ncbi:uncharacterized protein ACA1_352430 [Acanthamoeba castellanii str. Neff]|uniref:SAM domain-containing protein n=1 Tax=Acanthamoeba castellanii (strain ATCC 30010 / Neff) TaxID=1257118 RepID=L8GTQ8_ACACF|nr:uncharacterized protein ACA1_352430 [Acanthamoeba castellanii str. Neff]ELR16400.1 hypothetical protein ACA1_352430 [Acanthamoeba castellanii str. Neff]
MQEGADVKTLLSSLSTVTQRLLLSHLVPEEPQPARAAPVLSRLCELVEARGPQQLGARLNYHVLRSLCATLQLELASTAPTKDECLRQFVAFLSGRPSAYALRRLAQEDLDVLFETLAPTEQKPTTKTALRRFLATAITSTGVRSWLDSLPKELAERVAFDLDKEPAEGASLTDTILTAPPKREFNVADPDDEVIQDGDGDGDDDTTVPTKKEKKEPIRRGRAMRQVAKRRRSAPAAGSSKPPAKKRKRRASEVAQDEEEDHEEEEEEEGSEDAAMCHPEVATLLQTIGFHRHVPLFAEKGVTPERLIAMKEADLTRELGMSLRNTRNLTECLSTLRRELAECRATEQRKPRTRAEVRDLVTQGRKWARADSCKAGKQITISKLLPSLHPAKTRPSHHVSSPPKPVGQTTSAGDAARSSAAVVPGTGRLVRRRRRMLAPAPDEGPDVEVDLDVEDDVIVMEEDGIEVGGERPESMHEIINDDLEEEEWDPTATQNSGYNLTKRLAEGVGPEED